MGSHRWTIRIICLVLLMSLGCHVALRRHRAHMGYTAPHTMLIGGTGIYYASGLDGDYFYYNGRWYWCDGPYWYYSNSWGGNWVYIDSPPRAFLGIPPGHVKASVVYRHPLHKGYAGYRQKHYGGYKGPTKSRVFGKGGGQVVPRKGVAGGKQARPGMKTGRSTGSAKGITPSRKGTPGRKVSPGRKATPGRKGTSSGKKKAPAGRK